MDIKQYTNANKAAWNEVMPKHQKARKQELDTLFAQPGFIEQTDQELLRIFDQIKISDKDVIHLACNNGTELLSIKNMGARRCVGVDISECAIEEATERAKNSHIDCEFICSDVYELPKAYYNSFDVVHTTAGCIGWMPDINLFFNLCAKLLRSGGYLFMHEMHPFSEMLPFDDADIDNRLQIVDQYFHDGPIVENTGLDYLGDEQYEAKTQYWFVHTVSDIIMSLKRNGFNLVEFLERPNDISAVHQEIEILNAKIPLSMLILGQK